MISAGLDITPSAFKFRTIKILRGDAANLSIENAVDITAIVQRVRVSESLYSIGLNISLDIVDGTNLLYNNGLTGNEYVYIEYETVNRGGQDPFIKSQWLYTAGFSFYGKPKPDIQVYTVDCISATPYLLRLFRNQRKLNGTYTQMAVQLFNEARTPDVALRIEDNRSAGNLALYPNGKTHLDTIKDLIGKAAGKNDSPFFFFETFSNPRSAETVLTSYVHIIENIENANNGTFYSEYNHGYFYEFGRDQSDDAFEQKRKRILEIDSNLGFSSYEGLTQGGYIARTYEVDPSIKTYREYDYHVFADGTMRLGGDYILDRDYDIAGVALGDPRLRRAQTYMVNRNSLADGSGANNIHQPTTHTIARKRAIDLNLDQLTHEIKIHGDSQIRAGYLVWLNMPDPTEHADQFKYDELMTGYYLVTDVIHEFSGEGMFTRLKLKKDGIKRQFGSGGSVEKEKIGQPIGNGAPTAEEMNNGVIEL